MLQARFIEAARKSDVPEKARKMFAPLYETPCANCAEVVLLTTSSERLVKANQAYAVCGQCMEEAERRGVEAYRMMTEAGRKEVRVALLTPTDGRLN